MTVMPKIWAIIPAAGIGSRFGSSVPKQYAQLHDATVLQHTFQAVTAHAEIAGVVVVLAEHDPYWQMPTSTVPVQTVTGGQERADSVRNALAALETTLLDDDWVLVHDAARPCLHADDLDQLITRLADHSVGGLLAVPVTDTLKRGAKRTHGTTEVIETIDRRALWRALTPQCFRFSVLKRALAVTSQEFTDEASAVEALGLHPQLVHGRADNIKITTQDDLLLAAAILSTRQPIQ